MKLISYDANESPINYIGKISPRPLLLVQGDKDTEVMPENAENII
jgi:dipeptidyl aminopeptidase/acylaminoacyl peptidase